MSGNTIKAVQAFYNGTYYRSRTEARWAVFMDVLGIKFDYEPTKVQLPTGRYIPDFVAILDGHPTYIEIKGAEPDAQTIERFAQFCEVAPASPYLIHGSIKEHTILSNDGEFKGNRWTQCPFCGSLSVSPWDPERLNLQPITLLHNFSRCPAASETLRHFNIEDFYFDIPYRESPAISIALSVAQSARFEDPSIIPIVESASRACAVLLERGVFAHPALLLEIHRQCRMLTVEPKCPRFYIRTAKVANG